MRIVTAYPSNILYFLDKRCENFCLISLPHLKAVDAITSEPFSGTEAACETRGAPLLPSIVCPTWKASPGTSKASGLSPPVSIFFFLPAKVANIQIEDHHG